MPWTNTERFKEELSSFDASFSKDSTFFGFKTKYIIAAAVAFPISILIALVAAPAFLIGKAFIAPTEESKFNKDSSPDKRRGKFSLLKNFARRKFSLLKKFERKISLPEQEIIVKFLPEFFTLEL